VLPKPAAPQPGGMAACAGKFWMPLRLEMGIPPGPGVPPDPMVIVGMLGIVGIAETVELGPTCNFSRRYFDRSPSKSSGVMSSLAYECFRHCATHMTPSETVMASPLERRPLITSAGSSVTRSSAHIPLWLRICCVGLGSNPRRMNGRNVTTWNQHERRNIKMQLPGVALTWPTWAAAPADGEQPVRISAPNGRAVCALPHAYDSTR